MSWGGVPPATISVPNRAVAVTLNAAGDAQGTAAITRNEVDYYSFVAPRAGEYRFVAQTPTSTLDPVLGVFDSQGRRIAFNDDVVPGSNTDSDLTVSLPAGSRFYFGITNYVRTPGGSYTWLVNGPGEAAPTDDVYEDNDSLAQAADLGTLTATRTVSNLVMADGADWFRFQTNGTGTAASSISIVFQHSLGDIDLRLYDGAGNLLRTSDGVTDSEQIALEGFAAGTYFVQAYGFNGATNPSYTLTINPATESPPPPTGGFHIELTFSGLTASQQLIFEQAVARWEQVIVGDLPNATFNGRTVDDLLIDASAVAIDGVGGVLGQAGPDRFRSGSSLPFHGSMEFDTADLANLESNGSLRDVILHEIGHVLGIGTIWTNLGLLIGASGSNPCFTGVAATAAYSAIFGQTASCVPVENSGGPGTRNSHWRESILRNELMTGFVSPPGTPNPLSRITVGSLGDLGYSVDVNAADSFTPSLTAVAAATGVRRSARASLQAAFGSVEQFVSAAIENKVGGNSVATSASKTATSDIPVTGDTLGQSADQAPATPNATPSGHVIPPNRVHAIDDVLATTDLRGLDLSGVLGLLGAGR